MVVSKIRRSPTLRNSQQEIAPPTNPIAKTSYFTAKRMAHTAMFVALALVLKLAGQALTLTPTFVITIIYIAWILAGIFLGAINGALVGFLSDLLGSILLPTGPLNPLLVIGNTAYPFIAGLVYGILPLKNRPLKTAIAGTTCAIVCTVFFNSFSIWIYYGYNELFSFWKYFALYRWQQPAVAAINIAITCALVVPLHKALNPLSGRTSRAPQKSEKNSDVAATPATSE